MPEALEDPAVKAIIEGWEKRTGRSHATMVEWGKAKLRVFDVQFIDDLLVSIKIYKARASEYEGYLKNIKKELE